jgi:ABC-type polar amino acid transport system ATPase subunit
MTRPIIEFKYVNLWYQNFHALVDINETIFREDCVVICGPSGSGKSSLLRCVNGLEKFQKGDIFINGVSVKNCPNISKLRSKVGMVFQQFELYPHMTCLNNIALALKKVLKKDRKTAEKKALEAMEKFNVLQQADKYPAQLSGGQQQRIAICRSLVLEPEIIMFDEPTSALDPEMIGDVLEILLRLVQDGMTMLIVTHEMQFAGEVANKIIFMEDGKIIDKGSKEEFFGNTKNPRTQAFLKKVFRENV